MIHRKPVDAVQVFLNPVTLRPDPPSDVLLLDLMLCGRSGLELAADLREEGVPTTSMTASPYLAEEVRESGLFGDVIEKPFDLDDLLITISEALPARVLDG